MTQQFDVVIEQDEDGYYVASVPRLPGCHTQARSLDDLMVRIKEAILLCLEMDHDEFVEELKSENVFESAEPQNRAN
ncbi:MAG: type II toxin-antitoxin system HicB family antitoxin [Planctomycetota bacterium]